LGTRRGAQTCTSSCHVVSQGYGTVIEPDGSSCPWPTVAQNHDGRFVRPAVGLACNSSPGSSTRRTRFTAAWRLSSSTCRRVVRQAGSGGACGGLGGCAATGTSRTGSSANGSCRLAGLGCC